MLKLLKGGPEGGGGGEGLPKQILSWIFIQKWVYPRIGDFSHDFLVYFLYNFSPLPRLCVLLWGVVASIYRRGHAAWCYVPLNHAVWSSLSLSTSQASPWSYPLLLGFLTILITYLGGLTMSKRGNSWCILKTWDV